jgi:RND superfamily putative drug exporter
VLVSPPLGVFGRKEPALGQLDATIVGAVLLPASMTLLGDWNWYLPKWLEWLPELEHSRMVDRMAKAPPAVEPAN